MHRWQAYHTPTTVAEALSLLHEHQEKARVIAGGTDLILDMEAEDTAPIEVLVDGTPAAQVEVADAEVGAVGEFQGRGQGGAEVAVDVVEDAGHRGVCSSLGRRRTCVGRLFAKGVIR